MKPPLGHDATPPACRHGGSCRVCNAVEPYCEDCGKDECVCPDPVLDAVKSIMQSHVEDCPDCGRPLFRCYCSEEA